MRSFFSYKHDLLQERLLWCRLYRKTFKAQILWKMEYARKSMSKRWSIRNLLMQILNLQFKILDEIKCSAYHLIVLSVVIHSVVIVLMRYIIV